MTAKKENYWFMLKVLLLVNVILIAGIMLTHSNKKQPESAKEPCCDSKKINADILNSVSVKLM